MKKILVINGHPNDQSLCAFLAQKYAEGAMGAGHEVRLVHLSHLVGHNARFGKRLF